MCNEVGKKKRQGRDKMIMGKRNKMAVKNNRKNKEKKKKTTHFSRRRYAGCWIDDFLLALSN